MIDKALNEHPEDVNDVYDLLANKGRLPARNSASLPAASSGLGGPSNVKGEGENGAKKEETPEATEETAGAVGVAELPNDDPELAHCIEVMGEKIPDTYIRFGGKHGLPGRAWKALLPTMEPLVFNRFSLAALIPSGKREIDVDQATKVNEMMTGLVDDTHLTGKLRETRVLVKTLREFNEKEGRPARNMRLPIDWSVDAWWRKDEHTEDMLTVLMLTGAVIKITAENLGVPAGEEFLGAQLENPHSKARCCVVDSTGLKRKNCLIVLAESGSQRNEVKIEEGGSKRIASEAMETPEKPVAKRPRDIAKSEVHQEPPPPPSAPLGA